MEARGFVPVAQLAQPDAIFSEASLMGIFRRILPPQAPPGTLGGESRAAKIAEKLAAKAEHKDVGVKAAQLFAAASEQPSRTATGDFVREDVYVVLPGALGSSVGIKFRQDDPSIAPALEVKVQLAPAKPVGTGAPPTFAKAAVTLEELGSGDASAIDFAAGLAWVGSMLEAAQQDQLAADFRGVLAQLPEPSSSFEMAFGGSRIRGVTLPLLGVAKVRVKKSESLFKKLGAVEAAIEATLVRTRVLGAPPRSNGGSAAAARYYMSVCCEGGVDAHLVASNACWREYAAATPGVIIDGYPGFAVAVLGGQPAAVTPQASL